jgi:hypothetical protein
MNRTVVVVILTPVFTGDTADPASEEAGESGAEVEEETEDSTGEDEETEEGTSGDLAGGETEGEVVGEETMAVDGEPVAVKHQAAFGIPVPSERAAAAVNAALTALCTAVVAVVQSFYKYRGTEPPNPLIMELTMNSFRICLVLQVGLALYLYSEGLPRVLRSFVADLTGAGNPPRSKEEAIARRRRQMFALKVGFRV